MLTDWLVVRRLAAELDRALHGSRIRSVGRMPDGRLGLGLMGRIVAIDAFGPTPIVTLETDGPLEREAGWVRSIADALDGLRVDRVRARRGDRLIAFECASRSRFGVENRYRLVAELVPRFGNVVLLKDDTIVAAAKEFSRAENARRATVVGEAYEPPPLPSFPAPALALDDAFAALGRRDDAAGSAAVSAALRFEVPLVPKLVADSLVAEFARAAGADPHALAARCLVRANAIAGAADGEPAALGDVFVYRDAGALVQCHVVPLAQYAALDERREPAILALLGEAVGGATRRRATAAFDAKLASLRRRIETRRSALAGERRALERERDDAENRDRLRAAGDLLYAHGTAVPARATAFVSPDDPSLTIALDPDLDAKGNAAAYFKRYRKAVAKLEHVEKRLADIARDARIADDVAWELERADAETLDDVAESVDRIDRRRNAAGRARDVKRKPLDVRLDVDARVYVGRSPRGNADLTFRVARPDDLWFHARATPGAHVVLRIDAARPATGDELVRAASLAAYHSKARASEKVPVDYTERKYVRRQANAPPGLVWYTNARTITVAPQPEPEAAVSV